MMELIPEYKQELADLEIKMMEAQKFAEKFPVFAKKIISNKFTKDFTGEIENTYKGLYLGWGIKRWFYREKSNITNYRGDFVPQHLWVVYINQVSLFGEAYENTGLYEISDSVDVFFFDHMNTTFYANDEQIIQILDALANWYEKAKVINDEFRKERKKQKLLDELEKLK